MRSLAFSLVSLVALAAGAATEPTPQLQPHQRLEYRAIQHRLASGWNTWNTRSVTSHVLLPEGLAFNLAFKQHHWLEEQYLAEPLIGRRGDDAEKIRPGLHAYDGSYTELTLEWEQVRVRIESGHDGEDLIVLITPAAPPSSPAKLIVESALLWNRPGALARDGETLVAALPNRRVELFSTSTHENDPYVPTRTPYLTLPLTESVGLATGRARTVTEIRSLLDRQRTALELEAATHEELAEAYLAVQAGIAWNLIYEPKHERVVSTVGRLWNEEYGGYCLFGWDNFFLAYMTALSSRDLAYANVIEHLRGKTEEGFIPNDNRGNGSKSWDRSQPPVGSLMVREIYKRYPERWFLEATFDDLLAWNRWWLKKRVNDGLLAYGSHEAKNPFDEPAVRTKRTAGYESGMDDSPMYEDVPFNRDKNTMELQDVGLNSLYAADSLALADMAEVLGRKRRGDGAARPCRRAASADWRRCGTNRSGSISTAAPTPASCRRASHRPSSTRCWARSPAPPAPGASSTSICSTPRSSGASTSCPRRRATTRRSRSSATGRAPSGRRSISSLTSHCANTASRSPGRSWPTSRLPCSSVNGGARATSARTTRRSPAPATRSICRATGSIRGERSSASWHSSKRGSWPRLRPTSSPPGSLSSKSEELGGAHRDRTDDPLNAILGP